MFFRKKPDTSLKIDLHSHLIPAIDDGVKTIDHAIQSIRGLMELGFEGCVTTPHFYQEFYANEEENVLHLAEAVKKELARQEIPFQLETAGEYFIDNHLLNKIKAGHPLNSFGKNYLLVETTFLDKPPIFEEVIFELRTSGYLPVLAHPERYQYLFDAPKLAREWGDQGMLFQVTSGSLAGVYGKGPQKLAQHLIDERLVHFVGSDLHGEKHLPGLRAGMSTRHYKRALKLPLLNDSLLG